MSLELTEKYYQLVVIDVDGTLLDSQHRLSPGSQEAIRELAGLGPRAILASGRPRPGVVPLLEELGLGPAHIGAGGAYACGVDGELLIEHPLPEELLPVLVERARAAELQVALHTYDQIIIEGSDAHEQEMIRFNGGEYTVRVPDVLAAGAGSPCKLTLWGRPEDGQRYRAEVEALGLPVFTAFSAPHFLEVNSITANKGSAVQLMAQHLGVPLGRVIAIGDQFNDLTMFRVVGLPVAMGNAPEAVRRAAKVVAPSNDEGGVAWAIRKFMIYGNGHPYP